jgi:peroxiredoxin
VELPRLQPLYKTYKDQGFNVVVVDGKRQTEKATAFIEKHGLTYTALENGEDDAEVADAVFGVTGYPHSFLIDREGRVMYSHLGFEAGDEEKLAEEIETLLEF